MTSWEKTWDRLRGAKDNEGFKERVEALDNVWYLKEDKLLMEQSEKFASDI